MLQQLLPLIPTEPGSLTLLVATFATLVGAGMWLMGARFSRPVLTLTAVAIGTLIGKKLPTWESWSIDAMGPAVAGAVILGVSAFAFHRLWVGLWLGAVLACWTALAAWLILNPDPSWTWPAIDPSMNLPQYLTEIWQSLPAAITKYLPLLTGAALLAGAAAGILWPRIGLVLMWSTAGVSLLITAAALVIQRAGSSAITKLPKENWIQLAALGTLVAAGAAWQWRLTRSPVPNNAPKKSNNEDEN